MAVSWMVFEVLLFAAARDLACGDVVQIEVVVPLDGDSGNAKDVRGQSGDEIRTTAKSILQALGEQCPELQALLPSCRLAVDCEYVSPETCISPKSEIALIPPVSGG